MAMAHWQLFILFFSFLFFTSCDNGASSAASLQKEVSAKGEYIYRRHNEILAIPSVQKKTSVAYSWKKEMPGNYPKISKEYFRCKGSHLNPYRLISTGKANERVYDCGGPDKHSLPLRDGKEFVYPIFIELLNYVQLKTAKRVVITSGHRCPEHNRYVDDSKENSSSKHLIGGEVSFYVLGLEHQPEKIVDLIQQYYRETDLYQGDKEYLEFQRWDLAKTNVSTAPWYNKEIFIKLFNKTEGRNGDNNHPYPYLSLQMRYDRERKMKVLYSWDQAFSNFLRY